MSHKMYDKPQIKERPMMFNAESVRAILEGRKTQTRRVINPQPERGLTKTATGTWRYHDREGIDPKSPTWRAPAEPQDLIWVREACRITSADEEGEPLVYPPVWYEADGECPDPEAYPHRRTALYMPKWASRISLKIDDVRVQRLHEITEADAIAEAPPCWICGARTDGRSENDCACFHTKNEVIPSFEVLWNKINAKRGWGWDKNPWVWVIAFQPIMGNINKLNTSPRRN